MEKLIVSNEDVYLKTLRELVEIKSTYFNEELIIKYLFNRLEKGKIPANIHYYTDDKITGFSGKNIIGRIGNPSKGPKILLNAHVDTVNVASGWKYDPYSLTVEDGKAYGLGACDMKSGVAAVLLAIEELAPYSEQMKGEIIYTFVSDEEGPFGLGTNYLIHDKLIQDADVAIVTEPSAAFSDKPFPDLCLGAKGGVSFKIEFYGKSAHAALPEKGICAITDASKVVAKLGSIKLKDDGILGKGAICVTDFNGGGEACSVADYAYVTVFRHIVIGETEETVMKEVEQLIEETDIDCEYKISFRKGPTPDSDGFMPYVVEHSNKYVGKFEDVVFENIGKKPSISYFSSIGDFNYLGSRLNIPVLVFGPSGGNFHGADEWVDILSYASTTKILVNYLKNILL